MKGGTAETESPGATSRHGEQLEPEWNGDRDELARAALSDVEQGVCHRAGLGGQQQACFGGRVCSCTQPAPLNGAEHTQSRGVRGGAEEDVQAPHCVLCRPRALP
eukprot:3567688-Rhodomonas_salina.1